MWLDKLEYKFRRFGIPNLMLYIVIGNAIVALFDIILSLKGGITLSSLLYFSPALIMKGQIWRIVTFVLVPPATSSLFFLLISLYFYYFVGTSLENAWGTFRFTVYYLVGMIGSIIAGCISGAGTVFYLNMSLFFAYAAIFPERQVLLFFVIPIKVKYLGLLDAAFFVFQIIVSPWSEKLAAIMAIANFLIFFGPSFISNISRQVKNKKRRDEFFEKGANTFNRRF